MGNNKRKQQKRQLQSSMSAEIDDVSADEFVVGGPVVRRYAPQRKRVGQDSHDGDLGVQTVAPNSINAWLKSPGLIGSTS